MELFLLDIGNTHTSYGLMKDDIILYCKSCETSNIDKLSFPENVPVAAATVVPKAKDILKDRNIFWVDYRLNTGVDLSLVDASTLGADRIANLAALSITAKLPAIIVDCGTAVTLESLDANAVFRGGHIAPGRFLLRKSLNRYTAQLPFYPIDGLEPKTFGWTTEDAIRLGTDCGLVGAVKEFILKTKEELGVEKCEVFVTGGDSDILIKNIKNLQPVVQEFTLIGVAEIWKLNN